MTNPPTEKWCKACRSVLPADQFYRGSVTRKGKEYPYLSTYCRHHHNMMKGIARDRRDPHRTYDRERNRKLAAERKRRRAIERRQLIGEVTWALDQIKERTGLTWRQVADLVGAHVSNLHHWRNGQRPPAKKTVARVYDVYREVHGL